MSYTEIKCKDVKARKDYRCDWCNEIIVKREVHQYRAFIFEGDFQTSREHAECANAMATLNHTDWTGMDNMYEPGEFKRGTTESKYG